ncbi:MAG: MFS transporter [Myxococcota bacterium]
MRRVTATRIAYGIGMAAVGVVLNTFNMFLLFYYQQVLGLEASLCGIALFVALLVDAVTDPLVGVLSDRTRSRFGRRHPYMFASIMPLAICFYAVFRPPSGLGQVGLFGWLLTFVVGARVALTLFTIPHQSLVAELASSPEERVSLQSLRTSAAWLFGLFNAVMVFAVMLPPTPQHPNGLGHPAGYGNLAIWGATIIMIATAVGSFGTIRTTLARGAQREASPQTSPQLWSEVRAAWTNRSYRGAVLGGLALTVAVGFHDSLSNYVTSMFWGLSSDQISVLVVGIMGAAAGVMITARAVVSRIGKRLAAVLGCLLVAITWPTMVALRISGALPPPGDPWLVALLVLASVIVYYGMILGMTMVGAMIADITDEHELATGTRQEGLLFSAYTFLAKASSGLGILVSGVALKIAGVAEGAAGTIQDPDAVARLVFIQVLVIALLCTSAIAGVRGFRLHGVAHARVLEALRARRRTTPKL